MHARSRPCQALSIRSSRNRKGRRVGWSRRVDGRNGGPPRSEMRVGDRASRGLDDGAIQGDKGGLGPKAVSLAQCAEYPLVLADRSIAIHDLVAVALAAAGVMIQRAFHTNSIEAMKKIASAGQAIAFLSPYDIADEMVGTLESVMVSPPDACAAARRAGPVARKSPRGPLR